ncbi:MAG TPA: hypothetical protein VFK81_08250 [Terriglobales bacterium]|nr:hypothetical protein [Terriglobales bacterium]
MKPVSIAAVGLIGLAGVFLFELYVPAVLIVLGCCTLILVLGGTLLPANSRAFRVVFASVEGEISPEKRRRFQGLTLDPIKDYSFEARVQMIRTWQLGVLGVIALLEIGLVMAFYQNPFQAVREMDFQYFMIFCLCLATTVQLTIAAAWLLERRLLSISALAIGDFDSLTGRYVFRDERGDYYGGTKRPKVLAGNDNTCLVFYSSKDPQISIPSFRLLFHRLLLH